MAKVCIYTPFDRNMGGELGSTHVQLTTVYDVTENPDGPGLVCEVKEHRVITESDGYVSGDRTITFTGDLEMQ